VDLKKEIKLSDLLPRRRKGGQHAGDSAPGPEKPAKPKRERRQFSLSLSRGSRKGPKAEATPALPLPAVPLMHAFNLLSSEEARAKRTETRLGLVKLGIALLGLFVAVGLAGGYMLYGGRVSAKEQKVDALRAQLAGLQAAAPTTPTPTQPSGGDAEVSAAAQARTAAVADALSSRVAWDRVLRDFSLVLPNDVWLTALTAGAPPADAGATSGAPTAPVAPETETTGSSFTITGGAETQGGVALLLSRLAVVPEFSSVQLQSSTRDGDGPYTFAIVATVKPNGSA
jgi:Tfp pilus assembly protein PilN